MKSHGIEDRDGFLAHAMAFDSDDNGYLKKAELENAAKAWSPAEEVAEEVVEESAEEVVEEAAEEVVEEAPEEVVEEAAEESEGDKSCPICATENAPDSSTCSACGFTFE
jgi:TPP-dependent pyruvate/acetoin dehydrogenase alpha subunit